jgi:hypothetical protein
VPDQHALGFRPLLTQEPVQVPHPLPRARDSLSLKQQTKAALRRVIEYTQQQDTTPTVIPVQRPVQRGVSAGGPTT